MVNLKIDQFYAYKINFLNFFKKFFVAYFFKKNSLHDHLRHLAFNQFRFKNGWLSQVIEIRCENFK
jgi:hypothetical protein